jgi:3D (Asp-Asp-Asp) domain-containing protein
VAAPALLAKTALKRAALAAATRRGGDGDGPGPLAWLALALIVLPLLATIPFLAIQAGQPQGCGQQTAPGWDGPGSLGGVAGTGLTTTEMRRLRTGGGARRLSPALAGNYTTTAYAPAGGGINVWNGGLVTAGGIRISAGARRAYLLAVDRRLIPLGSTVYMWPNPYGWRGPFIAADTGGAILERRIDVYVFGNRATATAKAASWGRRPVKISATPILSGGPPAITLAGGPAGCADPANGQLVGGNGKWVLTPYANRPGVGLTPDMKRVLDKISSFLPRRLVVCTGTNHNRMTLSGNVSDHWEGNAADLCSSQNGFPATGGGYGDRIAAAAFRVGGYDPARANRAGRAGGVNTVTAGGLRIQILWKTLTGGNHFNHVHVGVRRV